MTAAWDAFDKVASKRHWAVTAGSLIFSVPASLFLGLAGSFFITGGPWVLFLCLSVATYAAAFTGGVRWVLDWVDKKYPWP